MHSTTPMTAGGADPDTRASDTGPLVRCLAEQFGIDARNQLDRSAQPGIEGAVAALETFYFALNSSQLDLITAVWAADPLVRLNNPLGGTVTGRPGVTALYERLFRSNVGLTVTLSDIGMFADDHHVVFAGREHGRFREPTSGKELEIEFRTTRYFRHEPGARRWQQFHHHGSVDDAATLTAYRAAVTAGTVDGGPGGSSTHQRRST